MDLSLVILYKTALIFNMIHLFIMNKNSDMIIIKENTILKS